MSKSEGRQRKYPHSVYCALGYENSLHPEFFIVERKKRKAVKNDVLQGLLDHHEHSVKVEQQVLDHQPTDPSPPKHERRCMRNVPAQALCSHVAVCVPKHEELVS